MLLFIIAALAAFLVVAGTTPAVRRLAVRRGWVDHPDGGRKRHVGAIPQVGGLAIAAGVAVGIGILALGTPAAVAVSEARGGLPVLIGGAVLVALGLWDDVQGIGFKRRFLVQVAVAYGLIACGWRFDVSGLPFLEGADPFLHALVTIPLTLLWIVGLINALNLIDGMDGLAGGLALVAFGCLGIAFASTGDGVTLGLCLVGAGATAGFLAYNVHPASIFMGDCGSTLLGFLLAMVGVRGVGAQPDTLTLLVPLVALGVPVLDTAATMARRMLDGKSPFRPDADHVHHRTLARTGSVRRAVRTLYAVGGAFGAFALGLASDIPWLRALSLVGAVVAAYVLLRQLRYVRTRAVLTTVRSRVRHHVGERRRVLGPDSGIPSPAQGDGAPSGRPVVMERTAER